MQSIFSMISHSFTECIKRLLSYEGASEAIQIPNRANIFKRSKLGMKRLRLRVDVQVEKYLKLEKDTNVNIHK